MALLLGIGPLVRWRRDEERKLLKRLLLAMVATLILSILLPWALEVDIRGMTVVGLMMSLWVIILTLLELHERATHRHGFWRGLTHLTRSHWGMVLGHLGVAVTVIGIAFSQNYSVERDVRMRPGDSATIRDYQFVFRRLETLRGPNYTVARAVMTEAAISGGITSDLYAALGEELDGGAWAVRLYYKPFVRWIWLGGLFMVAGGICCLLDPRYRAGKKARLTGSGAPV